MSNFLFWALKMLTLYANSFKKFAKWVPLHPLLAHKFPAETQFYWKV